MSEILEMEARIKDYVSSNIDKIETRIKGLEKTSVVSSEKMSGAFSSLGTVVKTLVTASTGLMVFRKVNDLFSESIRLAKTQIDAEQKLKSVLESTAGVAGVTYDEMTKLASSLQKVTTVGDETIIRGEAMLLTFTNIGKEVLPQATEAMLNLSIAMRTDVQQTSIQLGKALNDPIQGVTALRRVGIQLTEQQEIQIKKFMEVNDIASAQKIILRELETQFGNLARGVAKPDAGQIEQLKNQIGDVKEELGSSLLPLTKDWYELLLKISQITLPAISDFFGGKTAEDRMFGDKATSEIMASVSNRIREQQDEYNKLTIALTEVEVNSRKWNQLLLERGGVQQKIDDLKALKQQYLDLNDAEKGKKDTTTTTTTTTTSTKKETTDNEPTIAQLEAKLKYVQEWLDAETEASKYIEDLDKNLNNNRIEMYTTTGEIIYDVAPVDDYYNNLRDKLEEYDAQVLEATTNLAEAKVSAITDKFDQELALLDLKYQEEQAKYENNQIALAAIREKYELQQEMIEKKRASQAQENHKQELKNQQVRLETGVDYTIEALDLISKASKENSAIQKGIDIAQATANTYKGATKALSEGREWEVPLIIAMGLANVALIAAQKYAIGGIVQGNTLTGDRVPAFLNSREAVLTVEDQRMLLQAIRSPSSIDNSSSVNLNINLSGGSTYDMAAAQYTVDQLVPVIGDVLVRAKNEGRLRGYETAR